MLDQIYQIKFKINYILRVYFKHFVFITLYNKKQNVSVKILLQIFLDFDIEYYIYVS